MPRSWGEDEVPRDRERRRPQYQQQEHHSEETYHRRRASPYYDPPYHDPPHYLDVGEGPRRKEAFRGQARPEYDRNYVEREPGWKPDQPDRGSREMFRDRSPVRPNRNNWPRGRGRGQFKRDNLIHRDKWAPNLDNQQQINRNRREMDVSPRSGCEWEERRYSADERREGFYRNDHEPLKYEHKRNVPMEPPRREQFSHERDIHRQSGSRSLSREDTRTGGHFKEKRNNDFYNEERRTLFTDDRPNYNQNRDRPANRGAIRGNFNKRGQFFHRGRGGPSGNRPQTQRVQNSSSQPPRFQKEEEFYDEPELTWEKEEVGQTWDDEEDSGREMANVQRRDLEMQHPQEQWRRNDAKPEMTVITKETLTIKVDMSRPVNKNSLMLYSEDRPLSLDLVHVGRQRLDFLSEHQLPNGENAVQTGTFAQEIITLVHLVKDRYFGGQGVALTQRFSAPKSEKYVDEDPQGMTLSKRFSSSRGLNVNYNSPTDNGDPLSSRLGPLQLLGSPQLRDPDDLRHDLEKRRLERLEGVKVTIAGQSQPQRPLQPNALNPREETYGDDDKVMEQEEFSNWSEEPQWRREGPTGPKRGTHPFRQMRRPNFRNNSRGQNW